MERVPLRLPVARGSARLLLLLRFGRALLLVAAVAFFRLLLRVRDLSARALCALGLKRV
jgi:hypothetical protein